MHVCRASFSLYRYLTSLKYLKANDEKKHSDDKLGITCPAAVKKSEQEKPQATDKTSIPLNEGNKVGHNNDWQSDP